MCIRDSSQLTADDIHFFQFHSAPEDNLQFLLFTVNVDRIILKADKVTFRRGRIAYVSSTTNFVSMEGERAVIQLAFPNLPWPGANGLGGITVDGIVTNVSVKTDKKGFVRYQMSVVGSGTSSWMAEIVLNPLDNKASVTVYPTYSSNRVTLSGELVPYDRRSVYKGLSLIHI